MVKPRLEYRSYQARNCGSVFLQLIHPYVQKSTRTTLPRRAVRVSGGLLIQAPAVTSGARRFRTWPLSRGPHPTRALIRPPPVFSANRTSTDSVYATVSQGRSWCSRRALGADYSFAS